MIMTGGVDRVVVKTHKTEHLDSLLDIIHDLGKAYYCPDEDSGYKVCYFSQHTQGFFQGKLSSEQLKKIRGLATEVSSITLDEFHRELVIEL